MAPPLERLALPDSALRCGECDAPLPVGFLVDRGAAAASTAYALAPQDLVVGRAPTCDVVLPGSPGISREHARLAWRGDHFTLADAGSSYGLHHNGNPVGAGTTPRLASGDRVVFGSAEYEYVGLYSASAATAAPPATGDPGALARRLGSLDPWEVVRTGLEMLRQTWDAQRAYLIDTSEAHAFSVPDSPRTGEASLLTPLTHPDLKVSRSSIDEAVRTQRTVSHFVTAQGATDLTDSMMALDLRRVWVHPLTDSDGRPMAAVYLDSPDEAAPLTPDVEAGLLAVAAHIEVALRNATLHQQVVEMNRTLEARVRQRTDELESSQAEVISQDRLATLGRLVAAIAHELNNPAGAMTSFANTLGQLMQPVLSAQGELITLVPESDARPIAQALLDAALGASRRLPPDSASRRELERFLEDRLVAERVPAAGTIARRFARMGMDLSELEPAFGVLREWGEPVSRMAENFYTFGRSLENLYACATQIGRIVAGLKTYAHLDQSAAEVGDVQRGIDAALAVLAPRIPRGVEVVTHFRPIPAILHRPGEMTQVWTNLIDNAVRAMGENGTLTIETFHDADEDRVRVTVSDTGPGIPAEAAERIFDLGFTTRGPGAGLGLGLPICRKIIEDNHGGRIWFRSTPPDRTVFTVTLPRSAARPTESEGKRT